MENLMLMRVKPEIGGWYENREFGTLFEVVAIDDSDGTVAIQYFHGELEELEHDEFLRLPLRYANQPEDWTGPYEMEKEDEHENDFSINPDEWAGAGSGYDNRYMNVIDKI